MHTVQKDVEDFHWSCGIPIGDVPAVRRGDLRASLIMEEAVETAEAMTGRKIQWRFFGHAVLFPDLVSSIDGLCDLLCVTYGSAVEFGLDLAPFWDEVHKSNMAKRGGPVRADGKVLKPEGWQPPDIQRVLDEYRNQLAKND